MRKIIYTIAALFSIGLNAQDIISGGSNSWIFHTPDDGATSLFVVPKTNNTWDWDKGIEFKNNGRIRATYIESGQDIIASRYLRTMYDIILDNGHKWTIHNPGSGNLHFTPQVEQGEGWQWDKQIYFTKDANIIVDGMIGIGTKNPDEKLTVKGKIHSEEVRVDLQVPADYVFQKYYNGSSTLKEDYNMPTLEEVEEFTKANHHLPEIPSATQIKEEGLHLKEMTNLLLQKIEELTLYTIEQEKRIKALEKKLSDKE